MFKCRASRRRRTVDRFQSPIRTDLPQKAHHREWMVEMMQKLAGQRFETPARSPILRNLGLASIPGALRIAALNVSSLAGLIFSTTVPGADDFLEEMNHLTRPRLRTKDGRDGPPRGRLWSVWFAHGHSFLASTK